MVFRKCVITKVIKPKTELFRIVRSKNNAIFIDYEYNISGRGCYIVKDKSAIIKAKKNKAFSRFLKVEVPLAIYDALLEKIEKEGENVEGKEK